MAGYYGAMVGSGLEYSQPGLELRDAQYRSVDQSDKEPILSQNPFNELRYEEDIVFRPKNSRNTFGLRCQEDPSALRPKSSRNPFGLSPLVFGVLVALLLRLSSVLPLEAVSEAPFTLGATSPGTYTLPCLQGNCCGIETESFLPRYRSSPSARLTNYSVRLPLQSIALTSDDTTAPSSVAKPTLATKTIYSSSVAAWTM